MNYRHQVAKRYYAEGLPRNIGQQEHKEKEEKNNKSLERIQRQYP